MLGADAEGRLASFKLGDVIQGGVNMPENRDGTSKYTKKQERKAEHIEESYKKKGVSQAEAERRAWATVNKQDGGGKNPGGSGRKTKNQ